MSVTTPDRKAWARAVLARLGLGLGRDISGFYRPARLPRKGRRRVSRARVVDPRQLSLPFDSYP
jgi:hypothetical protein